MNDWVLCYGFALDEKSAGCCDGGGGRGVKVDKGAWAAISG